MADVLWDLSLTVTSQGERCQSRERQERCGKPRVKTYPLNSSRLTATVVVRIAAALGLLKASLADSRQMIEGTLAKDREPWSVQVDLIELEEGVAVDLRDASGVLLQIPPGKPSDDEEGECGSQNAGEDGNGSQEDYGSRSRDGSPVKKMMRVNRSRKRRRLLPLWTLHVLSWWSWRLSWRRLIRGIQNWMKR